MRGATEGDVISQDRDVMLSIPHARKLNCSAGYLHAGFCLHELGKTLQAKKFLLKGPVALLREPIYYYNMGCYDALLGNPKSAQVHLLTSFKMDPSFREIAKKDPDLQSVKELI